MTTPGATVRGRRRGLADRLGWGALALAVLVGALSGGVSGAASMFAMFALIVGLIALVRGQVAWARIRSRAAAAGVLAVSVVALTIGANAAPTSTNHADVPTGAVSGPSLPTTSPTSIQRAAPAPAASSPRALSSPKTALQASVRPSPPAAHLSRRAGGDSINAAGAILPNSARTPGALNPSVNQADINRTICVPGWTTTVRPPSSITTQLKVQQLASGYAYKGDTATGDYEEDHLISLELGGAPSATTNLWPEPYSSLGGARVKDRVENRLHTLVCDHSITLATAQHAIASNWWTAYQTYVGTTTTTTPAPSARASTSTAASTSAPVAPGNGATALCNDGTYSYAAHHQGACSHHGGVRLFYK